ncbi:MAG: hypothetical protein ACXVA9_09160 [Bdellovibrionales bacterium]
MRYLKLFVFATLVTVGILKSTQPSADLAAKSDNADMLAGVANGNECI